DLIERVTGLAFDGGRVTAAVVDTAEYEVELRVEGSPDGYCDCPHSGEGNFCKHCVAVALVFLYHAEHGTLLTVASGTGSAGSLAEYLTGLEHSELVELLLEAAERDPLLGLQLTLRAAAV